MTRGEGGQHTRQAASEPCPQGWGQEPTSSDQENVWLVSGERRSGRHRTEERDPQSLHKPLRWQNAAPMWGHHRQIPKPLEAPAPASREQAWVVSTALLLWRPDKAAPPATKRHRQPQSDTRQRVCAMPWLYRFIVCVSVTTPITPKVPSYPSPVDPGSHAESQKPLVFFPSLEMCLFRKCHRDGILQYRDISSGFLHVHSDF